MAGCCLTALFTAQGKVGSRLKLILAGTLGPMATAAGHWWFDLVADGTKGRTHVQVYQGDAETWDKWPTIRKANPLIGLDAHTRKVILEERDAARGDSRLKARFLSYRLNCPTGDESTMLLTVDDWKMVLEREAPPRDGRPIVAVDLGAGRAWSAAVAIYRNGRVECKAVAPGIPSIEEQEKRDRVPATTYSKLVDAGLLAHFGRAAGATAIHAGRPDNGDMGNACGCNFRSLPCQRHGGRWPTC